MNSQPMLSSTIPISTISNPTYMNSSAFTSEPIKPFDGLDQNYTSEDYLQQIEALGCTRSTTTFSLGLQPSADHEYEIFARSTYGFLTMFINWYIPYLVPSPQ